MDPKANFIIVVESFQYLSFIKGNNALFYGKILRVLKKVEVSGFLHQYSCQVIKVYRLIIKV